MVNLSLIKTTAVRIGPGIVNISTDLKPLFCEIDKDVYTFFEKISQPTFQHLAGYDLDQKGQEIEVISSAREMDTLTEVTLADVCFLMREHYSGKELFKTDGLSNFFFMKNIKGENCQTSICKTNNGFVLHYHPLKSSIVWVKGRRIFLEYKIPAED